MCRVCVGHGMCNLKVIKRWWGFVLTRVSDIWPVDGMGGCENDDDDDDGGGGGWGGYW